MKPSGGIISLIVYVDTNSVFEESSDILIPDGIYILSELPLNHVLTRVSPS